MPNAGDSYRVKIKEAHINWGTFRHTNTRNHINGEAYIKIPSDIAYDLGIMRGTVFDATSSCGNFSCKLRSAGSQNKPEYAKQFQSDGNLKILGTWLLDICNAKVGDEIEVYWVSSTEIKLTHIPNTL